MTRSLIFADLQYYLTSSALRNRYLRSAETRSTVDQQRLGIDDAARDLYRGALIAWLRFKLRTVPNWARGHLELARVALANRDIACAYASAQAVFTLRASRQQLGAKQILARCYLARQEPARAKQILEPLLLTHPKHWAIAEDLAAAHVALGDKAAAKTLIESIPAERRSGEAEAVRIWASS